MSLATHFKLSWIITGNIDYFTSEQLLRPTGSLKQLDIAMTAASIDASSPCLQVSTMEKQFHLQSNNFLMNMLGYTEFSCENGKMF